ncbi:MAG: beta-propeller fold lactonase family protein [Candidatus Sulfotelmatobacter sp.]|jgi:6-phosphogluconolactonase (cycloisomerase 2 family)
MLKKATALLVVSLSAASWISCGTAESHYLFTTLPSANQIAVFREDPNSGVLTTLLNSPFDTGLAPEVILLHPSGKYLYVANSGEDDISLFSIAQSTGIITEVSRTPLGADAQTPVLMAMDAAGGYLYVANATSGSLSVLSFASDGTLSAPTTTFLGVKPSGMALAPSGGFIFIGAAVPNGQTGSGQIEVWKLTAGVPTLVGLFPTNAANSTPGGLVVDSTGTYLYCVNGAGGNSISAFTIAPTTGVLTPFSDSPIGESGVSAPVSLLIDPSGKYLYVANQGSSSSASGNLAAYSIGSGGALTILTLSPFTTVKQPTSLAADPNGNYLMVGGQGGSLEVFLLDPGNGTLGEVATYSPGGFPSSIAILQ